MTRRRLLVLAGLGLGVARAARAAWLTAAAAETEQEIPLDGDGTGWRVRATVNGATRATFLLDTGASLCVLSPELARRANARAVVGHVDLRTANGIIRAPLVRLRSSTSAACARATSTPSSTRPPPPRSTASSASTS